MYVDMCMAVEYTYTVGARETIAGKRRNLYHAQKKFNMKKASGPIAVLAGVPDQRQ
jgi:hypothetical protein